MAVSFSNDIMPLFNQFKGQMMWRFDLTNYEHVKANASVIYGRINGGGRHRLRKCSGFDLPGRRRWRTSSDNDQGCDHQ